LDALCSRETGLFTELYTKQALFAGLTTPSGAKSWNMLLRWWAVCKDLDSI
jgi:hypothetical protein